MKMLLATALLALTPTHAAALQGAPELSIVVAERRGSMTELRLGRGEPFHNTASEVRDLRRIEVAGSSVLIVLWQESSSTGAIRNYSALSLDGRTIARVRETSGRLRLEHGEFDPMVGIPDVDARLKADGGAELRLVQFVTQPIEALLRGLERLGVRIEAYVADDAYVVHLNGVPDSRVAELPYVRWIGPHHPAYRLEEFLRQGLDQPDGLRPERAYNVLVFERGDAQKRAVADRVTALGGEVANADAGARLLVVVLTPEELLEVVRLDEVQFVDRWSLPENDMNIVRQIGGASFFHSTLGLTGTGVRGEVMDAGIRLSHLAFGTGPLIHGPAPNEDSHGTSTYGIVFGDGTPCQMGLLPNGTGIFADYSFLGNRYTHTGQLVNPALSWQAVFQSNSWGGGWTTTYTTISADMDEMLFDHDILIFQSQSNTGSQSSRPQAWAKNILSVGGINHENTLSTGDDDWGGDASIGPAADGRIKPDLAHFYDSIATTNSGSDTACTGVFCCTSAATPITAGHGGLWFALWHSGLLGNTPGATVFESRPHMTLSKAMLICTADQWTFTGATHDLTRVHQGWGRANVKNIYDRRDELYWVDETDVLAPLASTVHPLDVAAGTPALRATLVYADPPGNPSVQAQHRINDLTLKLVSPSGATYWGNHGLRDGMWSIPDGAADHKDTVECVFVQNPEVGVWNVEVIADEINQDGHVETLELDADYALVVSGATIGAPKPGHVFCAGDWTVSTPCPCLNFGAPNHGCGSSVTAAGAQLSAVGSTNPDTVTLTVSELPLTTLTVFVKGDTDNLTGVEFGDGVRCVAGTLIRFGQQNAIDGTATFPGAMPFTLSEVGGTPPGSGQSAYYQAYYRDADDLFCSPATFNISNGYTITW